MTLHTMETVNYFVRWTVSCRFELHVRLY